MMQKEHIRIANAFLFVLLAAIICGAATLGASCSAVSELFPDGFVGQVWGVIMEPYHEGQIISEWHGERIDIVYMPSSSEANNWEGVNIN